MTRAVDFFAGATLLVAAGCQSSMPTSNLPIDNTPLPAELSGTWTNHRVGTSGDIFLTELRDIDGKVTGKVSTPTSSCGIGPFALTGKHIGNDFSYRSRMDCGLVKVEFVRVKGGRDGRFSVDFHSGSVELRR